jgi:hypothetical protein
VSRQNVGRVIVYENRSRPKKLYTLEGRPQSAFPPSGGEGLGTLTYFVTEFGENRGFEGSPIRK